MERLKCYIGIAILVCLAINNVSAHHLFIRNDSDGDIDVGIVYTGIRACSGTSRKIFQGRSESVDTGFCCIKTIYIESQSGSSQGQSYELVLPRMEKWGTD